MKNDTALARRVRVLARVLVAALSVAVLGLTATSWVQLRALDRATPTAAVIDGPAPAPTAEQNILLVGLDSRTDARGHPLPPGVLDALHAGGSGKGGNTADTLIVVHVPAGGGRATAFSIPRDSYVDIPGADGKHKINSAYARASQEAIERLTGPPGSGAGTSTFGAGSAPRADPDDPAVRRAAGAAGARATIASVEQLTGLRMTHYAAVNLAGFADVSRAIGGIPVCLRAPVNDPFSGLSLPAGVHEVSGAQALAFVRQRHGLPSGGLSRVARQQAFLAGAADRLLSTGMLTDPFAISRLRGVVSRSMTLDAGWDLLAFARQLQGLRAGDITFRTIPTGTAKLSTPSDGLAVEVDPATVRAFVARSIAEDAGVPAPPPAAPTEVAVSRAAATSSVPSPAGDATTTTAPPPSPPAVPPPSPTPPSPTPPITAAAPGCVY